MSTDGSMRIYDRCSMPLFDDHGNQSLRPTERQSQTTVTSRNRQIDAVGVGGVRGGNWCSIKVHWKRSGYSHTFRSHRSTTRGAAGRRFSSPLLHRQIQRQSVVTRLKTHSFIKTSAAAATHEPCTVCTECGRVRLFDLLACARLSRSRIMDASYSLRLSCPQYYTSCHSANERTVLQVYHYFDLLYAPFLPLESQKVSALNKIWLDTVWAKVCDGDIASE